MVSGVSYCTQRAAAASARPRRFRWRGGATQLANRLSGFAAFQLFSYVAIWLKQYRTGSVVTADLSAMTWICQSAYKRP